MVVLCCSWRVYDLGSIFQEGEMRSRKKRNVPIMPIKFQARQGLFIKTDDVDEVLYGGAAGGGKTWALLWDAYLHCLKYPGERALLLRRTFPEVRRSFLELARGRFPDRAGKLYEGLYEFRFNNGSVLEFGHLERPKDRFKYQSAEYSYIGFDELTHFEEGMYTYLMSRCRSSKPGVPKKMRAATNPGGIGHCVPYGEVLTRGGWKDIRDVNLEDEVLSLDDGGNLIYEEVEQIHKAWYEGKMYCYSRRNAHIECTPEHRIVRITETKSKRGRKYHKPSLIEIKDIPEVIRLPEIGKWNGNKIDRFYVDRVKTRKTRLVQPDSIDGDDYCELMGWFLSEGYVIHRDKAFGVSQMKEENRIEIEKLLMRCGFKYNKSNSGFVIYSPKWYNYFKRFGKCREKYIPDVIKNATVGQIRIFLNTLFRGDGSGNYYYTSSEYLAYDLQEVLLKAGYKTNMRVRYRKDRLGASYEISIKQNIKDWVEKKHIKKKQYRGWVYCLGVKNHRFYLRQNGKIWLSGNSWVKKRFIDPAPSMTIFTVKSDVGTMTSRLFIPAKVQDNKILMKNDPGYIMRLNQLPEVERRMLRDGDWDIFSGQAFPELQDIHWIDPFPIPSGWERLVCMDWGYSKPFCVFWIAKDWDDYLYVYREWYGCRYEMENTDDDTLRDKGLQLSVPMVSKGILERSLADKDIRWWKADPSIWAKRDEKSIADIFAENGIYWQPADNHRIAGKQRLHDLLRIDEKGLPGIRFFKTCRGLRRTLPEMILDEKNLEDVDTSQEDHPYDALRYGIMSFVGHKAEPEEREYKSFKDYIKNRRKGAPSWKVAV